MGYSAGNLEFDIGINKKTVSKIFSTANALGKLASALNKINNTQFVYAGDKIEVIFTKISKATNSINTQNLDNLASAAKSLSSISRLSNLEKLDFAKVGKGFETLSVAIQPFLDKVREAEASLTALDGILRRSSGKKIQGLLGGGNGNGNGNGGGFGFAKRFFSIYALRRMGHFMANLVQAGSDYNETLNLWQVAMRNNLDVADQFINKMQKAYGISSKTLMNAQAVFKNMIGSLGQISDQTAYALSEALVQMSADYASLYNRTLESAFKNMQSMLAGQVRPIRSAGLDMTETTLYQYYQQLGGTKSMRQLNRTEKQLLSILAVYRQMGSAGALGDMSKTLNQFANQSRMMVEYWSELKTWSGMLLKDLIDQSGALIYINALLITTTEIVKAIAKSRGLGEENFIDGLFETTEATNDAVDELQGKLLDFDKFRSLEGATASPLAIDEKLLEAIAGYSSKIDQAQNKAQKLAESWMSVLGFTKEANGEFTIAEGKLDTISNAFEAIGIAVGIIIGYRLGGWLLKVATGAEGAAGAMGLLNYAILGGAVYAILQAIDAFERGDYWAGIFESAIGVGLVGAFLLLKRTVLIDGVPYLDLFGKTVNANFALIGNGILLLITGLGEFISNFDKLSDSAKVWIPIIAALTGVVTALAAGLTFLKGNWIGAIGLGAAVTGIGLMVGTQLAIPNYEMGASDIDSGTVFRAGEFGKTEAVYTGSNGKTNVANVRQMEQAFYNALSRHSREGNGTIVVQTYLDGEKVYENTTAKAKSRGNVWAKA
jgi:hypothetical protein